MMRVEFRVARSPLGDELRRRAPAQQNGNLTWVATRDLERYYHALQEALKTVELTEQECLLLCDALNGTIMEPHTIRLLWATVADAVQLDGLDRKWGVDGEALVAKLRGYSYPQQLAIVDAVERWWALADKSDRAASLREVGLVKETKNGR